MTAARLEAMLSAATLGCPVEVCTTIGKRRQVRVVVLPDGSAKRPGHVEAEPREDCKRDSGACFCTPCRNERKAGRA